MAQPHSNELPEFIALTGLDGTGKGYLAIHLRDNYGFLILGASEIISRIKTERPHLSNLHPDEAARQLKEELGPTFITDSAVAQFEANRDVYTGLVLDGVRRLPEIERVKRLGGKILNIEADPEERFKRLSERARKDAPRSIDAMLARDEEQLEGNPTDKNSLNMRAIMELADETVVNHYDDHFYDDAVSALKRLK